MLNITHAYVGIGYPLQYKSSTWCSTCWILRQWWWWQKCHIVFAVHLLDVQRKTYAQVNLLTIQHCYLLFIKSKWIIIKVFILVIFTLNRLRRKRKSWSCCLRNGRGGGSGGRRSRHTQPNFLEIHHNFYLTFLLFHFSKNVSIWCQSAFIVYFLSVPVS